MTRSVGVAVLLACVLCPCLLDTVRACSTVMVPPLASGANKGAVSVRSMDYGGSITALDLNTTVNIIPIGSKLWAGLTGADLDLEPLFPPQQFPPASTAGDVVRRSKPCGSLPNCKQCKPAASATRPATCYECDSNYELVDGKCVTNKPGAATAGDLPTYDDPRLYFPAKHSFVGAVSHIWKSTKPLLDQVELAPGIPIGALFQDRVGESLFSIVVEGLNDQGLACSLQYDASFSEYPTAAVSDASRPNILSVYNICKYILATFDNADEVVKALDPATTQIVVPKLASKVFFPLHVLVSDSNHQLWAAEFKQFENGDNFAWKNGTHWGVMTNEPQYEGQLANLEKYVAEHEDARAMLALVDIMEATGEAPRDTPLAYLQAPGSFSSADRFVRMALFNKIAPLAPVPHPRFSFMPPADKVPYAQNEALIVGLQFADMINRPIAEGTVNAERGVGVTTWRAIRDHTNSVFYFQAFADSVWGHVDVAKDAKGKAPINEFPDENFTDIDTYSLPLNMGKLGYSSTPVGKMF